MLRVGAVQLAARDRDQADLALVEALAAVDNAASSGAQLAVLPECTWPAYLLEARRKEMAPGTDVVQGRQPANYGALVATTPGVHRWSG